MIVTVRPRRLARTRRARDPRGPRGCRCTSKALAERWSIPRVAGLDSRRGRRWPAGWRTPRWRASNRDFVALEDATVAVAHQFRSQRSSPSADSSP